MTTDDAAAWRNKIGELTDFELSAFLEGPVIARLACLDPDGWPYVVPCWQEWDGSGWWVVPHAGSAWAAYLASDPRCAITVDEDGGTQRRVRAQCTAEMVEQPKLDGRWVSIATSMAGRYLGELGPRYLEPTLDKARWLFYLKPRKLITWQGRNWTKPSDGNSTNDAVS